MKLCIAAFLATATCSSGFISPMTRSRFVRMSAISDPEIAANGFILSTPRTEEEETVMAAPTMEFVTTAVDEVQELPEPTVAAATTGVVEPPAIGFVDPRKQIQPGRYDSLKYSLTLPFFERPAKLDGSHAGDYGFDPLGFTEEFDLYYMQECELRHARLAMLAAVGWPISELVAPDWMLQDGRAPSVLNGVNPLSFLAIVAALGAFSLFEYQTSLRRNVDTTLGDIHRSDMALIWKYGVAGDYNFDPYNLYSILGDDAIGRKALREVEVSHGRYAMVGITYFAAWEALTGTAIVENNPLFHPSAVVPIAALSYFVWSQFYQVSDVRKYPITIEYTKDGEEMLRGVGRTLGAVDTEGVQNAASMAVDAVVKFAKTLQGTSDDRRSDDVQNDKGSAGSLLEKIREFQESV